MAGNERNQKSSVAFDPAAPAAADAGIYGLNLPPEDCLMHLIPVPFEVTTSGGGGTARAPAAIVSASHQLDLEDRDWGRPWEAGIIMLPPSREVAALNTRGLELRLQAVRPLQELNALCGRVQDLTARQVRASLDAGHCVGIVGGDHASPFPLIEALSRRHPGLGILHVDAHLDLRPAFEGFIWSHASIMYNVLTRLPGVASLVSVGIRDYAAEEVDFAAGCEKEVAIFFDQDLARERFAGRTFKDQVADIIARLPSMVYISFDIDGLQPHLCPHTGTPVPGGLTFNEAAFLTAEVVASGRHVVGFDLCEVAPGPRAWDAGVAARILYKLSGATLASKGEDS